MEDSEQRKKRLKEMRHQAELSGGHGGGGEGSSCMPGLLSNPLIEAPSTLPSHPVQRFDFYTDPMNAFSSNKRNNNSSVHAAPDYYPPPNFVRPPTPQFSSLPYPESTNTHMAPSPAQASPGPYRNPVWNGPRGPAHYNPPVFNGPNGPAHYNSPVWNGPGGPAPFSSSPRIEPPGSTFYNPPHGIIHRPSHSQNPSPGYGNGPSPSPSPGRGRGRGRGVSDNNRSPISGRGSRQGSSSHGHWSNEDRADGQDRFYKRSMIEDPWKLLKPVIWKPIYAARWNLKPWTSESTSTKKEGPSTTAPVISVKPNSGPSLAEYLAAAFSEAADNAEKDAENV